MQFKRRIEFGRNDAFLQKPDGFILCNKLSASGRFSIVCGQLNMDYRKEKISNEC
jgi:hypothetical protein